MKKEKTRVGLEVLSPMLKLSTVFASFPPYSFNDKFKPTRRRYKIYTIALMVFIICISAYEIFRIITFSSYKSTSLVIILPNGLSNTFLLVLAVRTVILNYTKCNELKLFLYKLERFDKAITRNSTRGKLFCPVFVALHFVSLATLIFHAAVFGVAADVELYRFSFVKYFLYYFFCTNLIFVVWMCSEIKLRYDTLNNFLQEFNYHLQESNRSADVLNRVALHLKSVRMWHNALCNLVKKYNELFGIALLLSILFEISSILSNTVFILDMLTSYKHSEVTPLLGYMLFVCILCLFSSLVSNVIKWCLI